MDSGEVRSVPFHQLLVNQFPAWPKVLLEGDASDDTFVPDKDTDVYIYTSGPAECVIVAAAT